MDFDKFILSTRIIPIYMFVDSQSSRTIEEIEKILIDRVNGVESDGNDVIITLTDFRDGNKYICYSQNMLESYGIEKQFNKSLDMVAIDKFLTSGADETLKEDLETKKKEFLDGLNDVFTDVVSDETVKELEKYKIELEKLKKEIENKQVKELNEVVKIEGDNDKFYPIFINTNYEPINFTITRDSVHWDSEWYGRLYYEAKALTSHWGHGASFYKTLAYLINTKHFIANVREHSQTGILIFWLRGNTTYRIKGIGISLKDIKATEKNLKYKTYGDYIESYGEYFYNEDFKIIEDLPENMKLEIKGV